MKQDGLNMELVWDRRFYEDVISALDYVFDDA